MASAMASCASLLISRYGYIRSVYPVGGYPGIGRICPLYVRAGGCGSEYPGPGSGCHWRRDCPDEGFSQGKTGSIYTGKCAQTLPCRQSGNLLFSAFAGERDHRGRNRGVWQIAILMKSGNFQTVQEGLPQNVKSQPYMVSGLQTSTNSLYENFILRQPLSIT